ncbi:DciA family protein [Streptomyces sp. NPDC055709]
MSDTGRRVSSAEDGADLARVVLRMAREAAREARRTGREPGTSAAARRCPAPASAGRDPHELGTVVAAVMSARAWGITPSGGAVLDQWPAAAGELARRVRAVSFDDAEGRLDLLPDAPAYALQLRLSADHLIRQVNKAMGTDTVRALRVLAPGAGTSPEHTERDDRPEPPTAPRTSAGYRRALAAHRAAWSDHLAGRCP